MVACQNQAVAARLRQRESLARFAAGLAAVAVGLGALAIAVGPGRDTTYAGRSGLAATLTLGAGLALIVAGVVTSFFGSGGRIGDLAVLAGLVWFAPVWVGWEDGPTLLRSLGRLAAVFTVPLLMDIILAAPNGRLGGVAARALVLTVYLEAALVAVGLGLVPRSFVRPELLGQLHRQRVPSSLAARPGEGNRVGAPMVHRLSQRSL